MNTRAANPVAIDDALLARIEDAGINASAPREQRWVDGWLVRLSPGKAKRARCIQAVAPGRLGIDEKLALCLPLFAAAGLPAFVRVTPFSEPAGLDAHLAACGMERVDDTRVMVVASLDAFLAAGADTVVQGNDRERRRRHVRGMDRPGARLVADRTTRARRPDRRRAGAAPQRVRARRRR